MPVLRQVQDVTWRGLTRCVMQVAEPLPRFINEDQRAIGNNVFASGRVDLVPLPCPAAKTGLSPRLVSSRSRSIISAVLPLPGWPVNSSIGISSLFNQERLGSANGKFCCHSRCDHRAGNVEFHDAEVSNKHPAPLSADTRTGLG